VGEQLTIQATALGVTILWSALATVVIALIVKVLIGLRVDADQESEGLDRSEHGENAYPMEP
jgi:Amt family ammonium transporter